MMSYKFLIENILKPFGKATVHLGAGELSKRYLNYFNHRSPKRLFFKNKKYNCSILSTQYFENSSEYINTIKGKNSADYFSRRCVKNGYSFHQINPNDFLDSIFNINISSSARQGRVMDDSYLKKVEKWPDDEFNSWFGVFDNSNNLVAYIWGIKMNELVLINRILGHQDHLKNNIMYLLTTGFVTKQIDDNKCKYIMYDTFGKENNGLVLFKKRIGFKVYTINFKK